jgi:hypothetical protein
MQVTFTQCHASTQEKVMMKSSTLRKVKTHGIAQLER